MMERDCQARIEWFVIDRRRRNKREVNVAIGYGVLMALLAILAKWPELQVATAALAVCRAFAALLISRHQKDLELISVLPGATPQVKLERLLERDSSFLMSSRYWYALPLGLGLLLIAFAFWQHTHSLLAASLCSVLAVGVVAGSNRMNARAVAEMGLIRQADLGIDAA